MTRRLLHGLDGPLELPLQAHGGHRAQQHVVDEGEPLQHLVAVARVGHRHQHRPCRAARRAARPRPRPARPRGARGSASTRAAPLPSSAACERRERAHLLGRSRGRQVAGQHARGFRPRSGGGPWAFEEEGRGSVAQRLARRAHPRPASEERRAGRRPAGPALADAQRRGVEAPGDPGHPDPGGAGRSGRRSAESPDHPGLGRPSRRARPSSRRSPAGSGLRAGTSPAPQTRAKREATPRPSRMARLMSPGLVGEHGEGRPAEGVEGLGDARGRGASCRGAARGSSRGRRAAPRRRRGSRPAWRRLRSTRTRAPSPTKREDGARAGSAGAPGATRCERGVDARPRCRARSRRACRRGRRRGAGPPAYPGPT